MKDNSPQNKPKDNNYIKSTTKLFVLPSSILILKFSFLFFGLLIFSCASITNISSTTPTTGKLFYDLKSSDPDIHYRVREPIINFIFINDDGMAEISCRIIKEDNNKTIYNTSLKAEHGFNFYSFSISGFSHGSFYKVEINDANDQKKSFQFKYEIE